MVFRAPEQPFLIPPKVAKISRFSHFGGIKNGTQKVIFGPFIDLEYFTIEIPIDAEKN